MTKEISPQQVENKISDEDAVEKAKQHFSDESYRVVKCDQSNYLWPFAPVNCKQNSKVELRQAGEMGLGVFANADIAVNEHICCYFGKLTHIAEEYSDYTFDLSLPNHAYSMTVDSKDCGNISRYINHSYSPNCKTCTEFHYENWQQKNEMPYSPNQDWQYTTSKDDENRYYYYRDGQESVWDKPASDLTRWPILGKEEPHICFRTNKKISKDEQLFINYGKSYWATREKKPI